MGTLAIVLSIAGNTCVLVAIWLRLGQVHNELKKANNRWVGN